MRNAQQIIWDWNGTLLDDMDLCIDITNAMLAEERLTLRLTRAKYQQAFGFPIRSYYERLGFDLTHGHFERLAARFIEEYDERVYECQLHAGAADELARLRRQGVSQSILTAARARSVQHLVEHFGVGHLLDEVVGLDDHYAHGKVEVGRRWVTERRIERERTVLVGDTVHDHEVAEALGVKCQLVSHGHHSHERLEACGCAVEGNLFGAARKD